MNNLPVSFSSLITQMGDTNGTSRPKTFIDALQQSMGGIWMFNMNVGMKYLDAFKLMLTNKPGINWSILENDDILLELKDYAFIYVPKRPLDGYDTKIDFLEFQPNDVQIGNMTPEEIGSFKAAVGGAFSASTDERWREGMTALGCLNWVLMWCMIVWRFEKAREFLQKGYDLEIRDGWVVVACQIEVQTTQARLRK